MSGGRRGEGTLDVLEGSNTAGQALQDRSRDLASNVLQDVRDLGDEGVREGLGVGLLLNEPRVDLAAAARVDKDLLLRNQLIDGIVDDVNQVGQGLDKRKGLSLGQFGRGIGVSGALLDDDDDVVGGCYQGISLLGAVEAMDLRLKSRDARDDGGNIG